ncbi:helix-turn-helix domain-containing protein [Massilia sp. YIM B04103]|uniref:helix-turn-helix domain-containing protein n=1 Tax=Massilia sp. YIM B04103 TaxID=2963106 RepID=UPI00210A96E5|nr:helix-turn-helix transcriptional regulator [Massilia sp. YIM B04103]
MPITSPSSHDSALLAFGQAVRAERTAQGVSQEELTLRSGIDRSYLGAIERGEQNPALLHLVRISLALDVPLSKLMAHAALKPHDRGCTLHQTPRCCSPKRTGD